MSTKIIAQYDQNQQDARHLRGLEIAATSKLVESDGEWIVPSQSGPRSYRVSLDEQRCDCPDFETRNLPCKHLIAAEIVYRRETAPDGTVTETKTVRVAYSQPWHLYNLAQQNEEPMFNSLLRELCDGIPQPPQSYGRPRLPLSDVIYSLVSKAYAQKSGRRFTSRLNEAQAAGLVTKAPHYNSAFRYLESPELTPLLKRLIEESATPLRAIEVDFAVDSTGFATNTYSRWYDAKWGKVRSEARFVKTHVMTGVLTNIITTAEAAPTQTADAPYLAPFVAQTARTFEVREVSGDKAYSSRKNLRAVEAAGGTAYIPFKKGTNGVGLKFDGLWNQMWHYYQFNRAEFLQHYHKRSNVETTFSMVKAKFGGNVRAKTPVAQVNEVLCKLLAHNLCCLISSVYELGIEPVFWETFEAKGPAAPKLPLFEGY